MFTQYTFCITPDIDECAECHNAGCEQVCINTIGDFLCDCWVGFELTNDLYNCTGEGISGLYIYSKLDRETCAHGWTYTDSELIGNNTTVNKTH